MKLVSSKYESLNRSSTRISINFAKTSPNEFYTLDAARVSSVDVVSQFDEVFRLQRDRCLIFKRRPGNCGSLKPNVFIGTGGGCPEAYGDPVPRRRRRSSLL